MFQNIAVAATLAMLASTSLAADHFSYIGVDIGNASFYRSHHEYTSYGVFAGYHFNPNVALEGGYRRYGSRNTIRYTHAALSLVGTSYVEGEFNQFHVFGRLGYNAVKVEGCTCMDLGSGVYESKHLIGVGIGYAFTPNIVGRLEYQQPMKHASNIGASVAVLF